MNGTDSGLYSAVGVGSTGVEHSSLCPTVKIENYSLAQEFSVLI